MGDTRKYKPVFYCLEVTANLDNQFDQCGGETRIITRHWALTYRDKVSVGLVPLIVPLVLNASCSTPCVPSAVTDLTDVFG